MCYNEYNDLSSYRILCLINEHRGARGLRPTQISGRSNLLRELIRIEIAVASWRLLPLWRKRG